LTGEVTPNPGKYRIFIPQFKLVNTHIVPMLQMWIPKKLLKNGNFADSYNSRDHIVTLINGTYIDICTYDQDPASMASVELDGIWADEEMPERIYAESITRLISRKGKLWLTVTPLYSLTWAMKFWKTCDDPNVEVLKFSIHDNSHLPQKEKEAIIAQWPEHERASRESGEFMEFQGLVYKELDPSVHILSSHQPKRAYPVICAVDPHPRKATVVTWAYVTPQDDVVFFDELEVKGTATEIVAAILRKEATHGARTQLRVIDPAANKQVSGIGSSRTTLREFQEAGMNFSLADNATEAGMNVVHEYVTYDKSKPVGNFNRPRCYFTADVPKTWEGMTSLLWDEWGTGNTLRDEKERVKDYKKDFPDCVRYTLVLKPSARQQYSTQSVTFRRSHR
jgi:phage terminase large subunit-like protein